ncbi:ethanolamine utilization protein EutN [Sporanaerobium hydrogeniformans]|uniref:Ethanolamine utilization protein EutN n=1 Tax=Sporanaerobium hydrogeniformans TaxID=3072179 RepID=A0AC61DGQ0_9FIRM|nr:EutN/CcmL family microcompartment protein [Sporanaerobium hydrogeniformans]PHV72123.1 ethanolamine utilization protein EutN [Sporanaerobium hydrogeniformans]
MTIAKVIGSIVSTRKHQALVGNKFLLVETLELVDQNKKRFIAIDTVGAGVGEIVLITTGSGARCSIDNSNAPVDAAIVGIVDDENHLE